MERSARLAEAGIVHGFGNRRGGVSQGLYATANAGFGSDDMAAVLENRRRFANALGAAGDALCTLKQVHGHTARQVTAGEQSVREGDALVSATPGLVLAVTTADCVPVLLAEPHAGVVAAVHAGWRGAVAGVVEQALVAMAAIGAARERVVAGIGPCIRQASYEVDRPLREQVLAATPWAIECFAAGHRPEHWQFDLPGYVAGLLRAGGVFQFDDSGLDTLQQPDTYFSHRYSRQRGATGYGVQLSGIRVPA